MLLTKAFALTLILIFSTLTISTAHASAPPTTSNTITGSNGVTITEQHYVFGDSIPYVEYAVHNNSSLDISAFIVSGNDNTTAQTYRTNWSAQTFNLSDGIAAIRTQYSSLDNVLSGLTWDALFGTDTYAYLYINQGQESYSIASGDTAYNFSRGGSPASNFIALGANNTVIISQSIPEPSSIIILSLGLMGLLISNRRKV